MSDRICERCGMACSHRTCDTPWHRVKIDIVALVIDRSVCEECSVELGKIIVRFFNIPSPEEPQP